MNDPSTTTNLIHLDRDGVWLWTKQAHTPTTCHGTRAGGTGGWAPTGSIAWLALLPASIQSGCMKMVAGCHRGTGLAHKDLYHEDNMLTRSQKIVGIEPVQTVDVPLQTRQASLHPIATAQASEPNNADKVRPRI